jgi:hypothetical protein
MFVTNPVSFERRTRRWTLAASLLDKPLAQTPESLRRYLRHPTLVDAHDQLRRQLDRAGAGRSCARICCTCPN